MHFRAKDAGSDPDAKSGRVRENPLLPGIVRVRQRNPHQWRRDPKLSGGGAMMDIGIYSSMAPVIWLARSRSGYPPRRRRPSRIGSFPASTKRSNSSWGFPAEPSLPVSRPTTWITWTVSFSTGRRDMPRCCRRLGMVPPGGVHKRASSTQPDIVHQTVQMDAMSDILLRGGRPVVPADGEEALKDMLIIRAIYEAAKTGQKVMMKA